jgi:hypothetical protein
LGKGFEKRIIWGIRTEALLKKFQGEALLQKVRRMDAPGHAEAGVEGSNRMFATGTPNPPCSDNGI